MLESMAANMTFDEACAKLDQFSRLPLEPGQNPYAAFIKLCDNNPKQVQSLYTAHRNRRNAQQKAKFLAQDYRQLVIDQHLLRLENPLIEPGFKDERNCFVFWARPPEHVLKLASKLQGMLQKEAPNVWLMPTHRMHMTTLEVAFSKTPREIEALVSQLRSSIASITSYTRTHRSRLIKPMISYDLSAFALSFVPTSGEQCLSPPPVEPDLPSEEITQGDAYTYHHLRRDVFDKVTGGGVHVGSRYEVPSAHITLGRYLVQGDHDTHEQRKRWVEAIDELNEWLEREVWDKDETGFVGEWVVGQEKGLEARNGTLWYGGGRAIMMGEGF